MFVLVVFTLYIASGVQIVYRNDDDDEDDDFDNFTTSRCIGSHFAHENDSHTTRGYYIRGMIVTLTFWHLHLAWGPCVLLAAVMHLLWSGSPENYCGRIPKKHRYKQSSSIKNDLLNLHLRCVLYNKVHLHKGNIEESLRWETWQVIALHNYLTHRSSWFRISSNGYPHKVPQVSSG